MSNEPTEEQKLVQELRRINEQQSERILQLEEQLSWLNRQIFGRKSEQQPSMQPGELFDPEGLGKSETSSGEEPPGEEGADAPNDVKKPRKKRKTRARKIPANLPVRTEYHDPEEVLQNPGAFRLIKEEPRESLGKQPGHFYRKIDIYRTWVPKDPGPGDKALTASAPARVIVNGYWQSDLISEIICQRFLYHLPYDRQHKLYLSRHGIDLAKQTMCDAALQVAEQCRLLTTLIKKDLLAGRYLRVDETKARYLASHAKGGSSLGWFWLYKGENGNVLFDWQLSRQHHHLRDFLGDEFEGVLGSDAYEAYLTYCKLQKKKGRTISRSGCHAHVRRKFENALDGPKTGIARWVLRIFAKLYRIEATLKQIGADAATKVRYRQRHSLPQLKLLKKACLHLRDRKVIRPAGKLGRAIQYLLNNWEDMCTYLEHGYVEIDNNGIERDVRPLAIGRRNWLFLGSPESGHRAATLYSLLISARHHGHDPETYLRDLIERLPGSSSDERSLRQLLPENWKPPESRPVVLEAEVISEVECLVST